MKLRVTASTLNLRAAPNDKAPILAELKRGTTVDAVEPSPWRYVRLQDGRTGWVHGSYVESVSEAKPAASTANPKWRVAKSLDVLLKQIDAMAPKRSKKHDGSIGDEAHASRASDHNPDKNRVVKARDYTHDPANGADMAAITETLRVSRDPRINYVIHAGRIFSSTVQPWKWRKYTGADAHLKHAHVSVVENPALYDDTRPWAI